MMVISNKVVIFAHIFKLLSSKYRNTSKQNYYNIIFKMINAVTYIMYWLKYKKYSWIHEKVITQPVIISIKTEERAKMKLHNIHSRWNDALRNQQNFIVWTWGVLETNIIRLAWLSLKISNYTNTFSLIFVTYISSSWSFIRIILYVENFLYHPLPFSITYLTMIIPIIIYPKQQQSVYDR